MKRSRSLRWCWCVLALLLDATSSPSGQADRPFVRINPEDVKWVAEGNLGVQVANVEGDPSKPGFYMTMIRFPPGVMSRPHFHPADRYIVVLRGTWYTATGDRFEPEKALPVRAGGYMRHPAGGHHYDGAGREEVILAISGHGPNRNNVLDGGELFTRWTPAR